ncbi:MAG: proline--tRNA ligase [Candidatus Aenigmarchaeota archaeon]|nr:proline--tRNA ligase [Candidatus Aenigmarchaeota archaeon]
MDKNIEGLTVTKEENFSEWYQQLILKSELADYSSVSGCIIFRPTSFAIWEMLRDKIDKKLKKIGVKNVYFPMFIPESLLTREKEHVEGFTPEVAWVTQTGNTKLEEKLAVRPTSEAIMYDSYSKWIRSWRDLPLKYNQWNNVVRWEFKNPVPFFRTREFLWNEGHTVFATEKEAKAERDVILGIYSSFLKDYMALPHLIGYKTKLETFAGAVSSCSCELYLPNGKAIQGPIFHYDGQKFAKAYDIKFLNKDEKMEYTWQNTWAISTRMLGVMFAMHSDNKGLVLPPKLAPIQIVIVPILFDNTKDKVLAKANEIKENLSKEFSAIVDEREEYSPGWKFNEWELKGVPIRLEFGPRDLESNQVVLVRRDKGEKQNVKIADLKDIIVGELNEMQQDLYDKAKKMLENNIKEIDNWEDFTKNIKDKKIALIPFCGEGGCEEEIKDKTTGAKSLNRPLDQPDMKDKKCARCGKPAAYMCYFGKSY